MSGRFSKETMTAAMRQIATVLGVPSDDAELLRLTNNAVFALPRSGIVIRIGRTHRLRDRVTKVVQLAQWFAEIDAPTIRLPPGVEQPIRVGELVASIWTYVPPLSPAPAVEDLGLVLREFHALGVPSLPLPLWDPIQDARQRLADAEGLDGEDRDFLLEWCDRLDPQISAFSRGAELKLIHGDAHVGNLLRHPSGRTVMCDFDATCIGPWQVDLAAVAVGEARFGVSGAHRTLATAYGFDVTSDPSWPLFCQARELKMIVAAVPLLATSTKIAAEFATRLRSVQEDDHETRWTAFADLTTPIRKSGRV
ncbi:aminoglycoside phosphotransferase family protein [Micromonospora halophytica]|uniref:Ser/Thr protein kinase RdoA involved in Cpx stress response, MazF antagonist n=1 Tax=Micromonospora halophytica TaxID=47864 RepID=A0A1C5HBW8_9ACTN|nr:aminoglycoside phosphotransferase family protein [Micromonospora halophytica]SCG43433.1 Ser/Thr protein kinase RdoA involved in Cpx stress response, MazF antagonist [Micromonospora halophytica]